MSILSGWTQSCNHTAEQPMRKSCCVSLFFFFFFAVEEVLYWIGGMVGGATGALAPPILRRQALKTPSAAQCKAETKDLGTHTLTFGQHKTKTTFGRHIKQRQQILIS